MVQENKLSYGELISPNDIELTIGHIVKPTIGRICDVSFEKFQLYEAVIKATLSEMAEGEKGSLFRKIFEDETMQKLYTEALQFFFREKIMFAGDVFMIVKTWDKSLEELAQDDVAGIIAEENWNVVAYLIQQVCCIADENGNEEPKYKNETARKLAEKMKQNKIKQKADPKMELPNIISAVCGRHPSINYTNVWQLTLYQVMDSFNRLQLNAVYDIDKTRVSVWGDEKKTFDISLWYKSNE